MTEWTWERAEALILSVYPEGVVDDTEWMIDMVEAVRDDPEVRRRLTGLADSIYLQACEDKQRAEHLTDE